MDVLLILKMMQSACLVKCLVRIELSKNEKDINLFWGVYHIRKRGEIKKMYYYETTLHGLEIYNTKAIAARIRGISDLMDRDLRG